MLWSGRARLRIVGVVSMLRDLWGDELPPGREPWRRVVTDVIDEDDRLGRRKGLVVQGDALSLDALAAALAADPDDPARWDCLPADLAQQLRPADSASSVCD